MLIMKLYIETERLLLREWTPNDLPTFIKMNQDPEVMEFFPKILDSKESIDFYQRICKEFDKVKYGLFAVERKSDHKFIGYTGLHKADFPANFTPCIEIGWRLIKDVWNQGYATEAAKACLQYGFINLNIKEIYSFTAAINKRSERVMQKIGLQKIGEFEYNFRESSMQTRSVQKFFFRKISLCIIKTIILYIKNRPYYEI